MWCGERTGGPPANWGKERCFLAEAAAFLLRGLRTHGLPNGTQSGGLCVAVSGQSPMPLWCGSGLASSKN